VYRAFADAYGWTPAEVDALPVEFVEEQLVVWRAEVAGQPKKVGGKGT
jgi:hypothetical protein